MARRFYSNASVLTQLAAGISNVAVSLTVNDATGYPSVPFVIVIEKGTVNEEYVLVGAKAGAIFSSLTRGYDGSIAVSHSGGVEVEHVVAAVDFDEAFTHDHDSAAGYTQVDHGKLLGNADDDHTQYHNDARHDTPARHGVGSVDHGGIAGLADDDHTQYHNDGRALTWLNTRSSADLSDSAALATAKAHPPLTTNPHAVTAAQAGAAPSSHVGAGGTQHANAVAAGAAGFMSGADKTIVDSVNGHPGAGGAAHANVVAAGAAGFMTGADKTKLDGIESGATADQTAAEILTLIKTVDGAGSGLDADFLDGLSSGSFATSGHTHSYLPLSGGTLTGALNLASGSAASPALRFSSDPDTGIYYSGASGYISFANNGVNDYAFGPSDFTLTGRGFMPDLLFDNTSSTVRFISGGEIKQAFSASSLAYKEDVADWDLSQSRLGQLRPIFFRYPANHPLGGAERWGSDEAWEAERSRPHGGLAWEEAVDVIPELCHGDSPEDASIAYEALIPELVADYLALRKLVLDRLAVA